MFLDSWLIFQSGERQIFSNSFFQSTILFSGYLNSRNVAFFKVSFMSISLFQLPVPSFSFLFNHLLPPLNFFSFLLFQFFFFDFLSPQPPFFLQGEPQLMAHNQNRATIFSTGEKQSSNEIQARILSHRYCKNIDFFFPMSTCVLLTKLILRRMKFNAVNLLRMFCKIQLLLCDNGS